MIMTKRRVVSVEGVTAKLDALAARYRITGHCYSESASDSMTEFDALKWTSLCSQRRALEQRESQAEPRREGSLPLPFLSIYHNMDRSTFRELENTYEGMNELAA